MCIVQPASKRADVITPGPRHLLVRKQEGIAAQEEQAAAASFLPQLDLLWHYDCVVSPILNLPTSPTHYPAHIPSSTAAVLNPALPADSPRLPSLVVGGAAQKKSHFQRRTGLQRVFRTFDQNRDGRVSIQEITQIFHRLGITPRTQDSIYSLLARLVPGSEGHVDEQEFCLLYDSVCCSTTAADEPADFAPTPAIHDDVEQDLLAAFHLFDKDGNGFITPRELQTVLCSLGFPQARQLDACVDMIARVDENGDGQVDFLEFKRLFDMENASLFLVSSF